MIPLCILAIEDESERTFMTHLYQQYHRLMYQQIIQIVHDQWAAEDLMQETILKLIDKIDELKAKEPAKLVNYIISACKNRARHYIRDHSRHQDFSIDEYLDVPDLKSGGREIEARLIRNDDLRCLVNVWSQLDERSRYILESYYILERPMSEIAQDLGIKPDSARMALTRARRAAYQLIDE